MKLLLISLLLCCWTAAEAQNFGSSRLRTQITDDGRTLSIRLDGERNGRRIHYAQTFDVSDMNRLEKEVLKYRVFRSQGLTLPLPEMWGWLLLGSGLVALGTLLLVARYGNRRGARHLPA